MAKGAAAANELQIQYVRQALGIRSHGQQTAVLALETGLRPVTADWLRLAARFWDRALKRPDGDLVKEAVRESWQTASGTPLHLPQGWAAHLRLALYREGYDLQWGLCGNAVEAVILRAEERWLAGATETGQLPPETDERNAVRSVPTAWSTGYKMLVYKRWMHDPQTDPVVPQWESINNLKHIGATARFRMGVHHLRIETGRHGPARIPREDRTCRICEMGAREDEAHVIFECPAFADERAAAYALFTDLPGPEAGLDARMRAFMNPREGLFIPGGGYWKLISKFLYDCEEKHKTMLETIDFLRAT